MISLPSSEFLYCRETSSGQVQPDDEELPADYEWA